MSTIQDVLEGRERWCVETGSCFDYLSTIPDDAISHAIVDPPYSEHVHGKSRAGARKEPLRDGNGRISKCAFAREATFGFDPITQEEMEAMADQFARVVRGWVLVFSDVESSHLWAGAFRSAGLDYCRTMAWVKVGATPQFTGDRPGCGFEAITVCHRKGRKRWNAGGKLGVYTHLTCLERGGKACTNDRREHPTQKPLPLLLELETDFTNPDDIILDTHCGSGTHLVAALRLGRRAIGFEKNEKWATVARERCAAELSMSSAVSARAGQVPLFGAR